MSEIWMDVLVLPFTLLGKGLRWLSLSGGVGNVVAIVLFVLIALLPLVLKVKHSWKKEDWLLPMASVAVLYTLYYAVNPGLRPLILNNSIGSLSCAMAVYSILLLWIIIKLFRNCDTKEPAYLYRLLRVLLFFCGILFLLIGFAGGYSVFLEAVSNVKESNTAPGITVGPTVAVLFLGFLAGALEYGLDALLMLFGIRLLKEAESEPYSEACFKAAKTTEKWCRYSLVLMLGSRLAVNLLMIALADSLYKISMEFTIPIFSIALTLGMLVVTKLLYQGKEIKEDNDLFI